MTEILPNWNLKDFYSSYEDLQIEKDINLFKKIVNSFIKNIMEKF